MLATCEQPVVQVHLNATVAGSFETDGVSSSNKRKKNMDRGRNVKDITGACLRHMCFFLHLRFFCRALS